MFVRFLPILPIAILLQTIFGGIAVAQNVQSIPDVCPERLESFEEAHSEYTLCVPVGEKGALLSESASQSINPRFLNEGFVLIRPDQLTTIHQLRIENPTQATFGPIQVLVQDEEGAILLWAELTQLEIPFVVYGEMDGDLVWPLNLPGFDQ